MDIENKLRTRSESKCELCSSTDGLTVHEVPPKSNGSVDECVLVCQTCLDQIENPEKGNVNHWRCLNDTMWTPVPAVQVMIWRMLYRLRAEGWPQDLLDMLYLDDETLRWAEAGGEDQNAERAIKHLDSNGALLVTGDTVVLIKDLNVKGGGFTAKRGTPVRGISLVADNAEQIEGRVSGQQIVILSKFVKKSN
jgi:protein PhnA